MTWVLSPDGREVAAVRDRLPAEIKVSASAGDESAVVALSEANAAEFGWFEVTESEAPSPDHVAEIVAQGAGFVRVWRFDPDVRAERLRGVAVGARRGRLVERVAALRAIEASNQAATLRTLAGALADLIEERVEG